MEILGSITRNVLIITMIASFLEIMLPESSMRPFVRFVIGLFVIISVLNPLVQWLYHSRGLESQAWDLSWNYESQDSLQKEGLEMNQQLQSEAEGALKQKLENQVRALTSLVPGVAEISPKVKIDPQTRRLDSIELAVKQTRDDKEEGTPVQAFSANSSQSSQGIVRTKLLNLMENMYGIDRKNISIKFEGD
ncbi:MAG: stage III sporulation protein AF [Candidatus Saccharibacteria bacterium]